MSYRIVSDSSSNLLEFKGNEHYTTVPLKIMVDGVEFVDQKGLDTSALVNAFEHSTKDSTSCPNAGEWMEAFGDADEVYAVTISSNLSGSYAACVMAKEQLEAEKPEVKVHVFDSKATGGSMQLIIEKIAECKEAGMGFEETVDAVNEYYKHTKILFLLESLGNLSKNGRVNPAVAKVASFLGIRFLGKASEEGTIQQASIARGAKKAFSTLLNEILKSGYNGGKLRLSHCLNPDQAHKIKDELLAKFPDADIVVDNCTGLCSYYAERGGMIVCFEIDN
jgi:DegV family protein with EDD domain